MSLQFETTFMHVVDDNHHACQFGRTKCVPASDLICRAIQNYLFDCHYNHFNYHWWNKRNIETSWWGGDLTLLQKTILRPRSERTICDRKTKKFSHPSESISNSYLRCLHLLERETRKQLLKKCFFTDTQPIGFCLNMFDTFACVFCRFLLTPCFLYPFVNVTTTHYINSTHVREVMKFH